MQSESCKVVSRPSVCSALSLSSAEAEHKARFIPCAATHTTPPCARQASLTLTLTLTRTLTLPLTQTQTLTLTLTRTLTLALTLLY